MPTYQYACTACGEQHEAVQSFTDAPLTDCPACGGRLRKVFSAVGVVFKGSGFYKTDSRASASKGPDKGSDKSGDKGSDKGAGDSSGAKTAAASTSGSTPASSAPAGSSSTSSGSTGGSTAKSA